MTIDRIAPTLRPAGSRIGCQTWTDLTLIHWRVPVAALRPLIPTELDLDTDADGAAWLGLVPFRMSRVRPWWAPALPWLSAFPETNVRTYVHCRGANPGVWFFSLDAARVIPVWIARTMWHLNYHWARMSVVRQSNRVCYLSRRFDGTAEASLEVITDGPAQLTRTYPDGSGSTVEPGSLEHFLVERYFLYTTNSAGHLFCGQVHHRAYPLRLAQLDHCHQTLTRAVGIEVPQVPDHVLFSPGVTVDIFPLRRIKT